MNSLSTIEVAKDAAAKYRFTEDRPNVAVSPPKHTSPLSSLLLQNTIEISQALTPALANSLAVVCERLNFPRLALKAFTYSSSEIQAQCFNFSSETCLVGISSALIDLLEAAEFEFVVGHELGHFLFGHSAIDVSSQTLSPQYFLLRRAQEISVDRVGLKACGSLDASIRALMKSASGLSERHLRFDVSSYLDQLRKIDTAAQEDQSNLTHPSLLIRSRALLWFSLDSTNTSHEQSVEKIDSRISKDLHRYVDGRFRKKIEDTKGELLLWTLAQRILENRALTQVAQQNITAIFGSDVANKIREVFQSTDKEFVGELVFSRKRDLRDELEQLIPHNFVDEVSKIQTKAEDIEIS